MTRPDRERNHSILMLTHSSQDLGEAHRPQGWVSRAHTSFPGLRPALAGRGTQGPGDPVGTRRARLTCVASSRACTSRIRNGSRPRPAVQKNRAPPAGSEPGSAPAAAIVLRRGPETRSRELGRVPRVLGGTGT